VSSSLVPYNDLIERIDDDLREILANHQPEPIVHAKNSIQPDRPRNDNRVRPGRGPSARIPRVRELLSEPGARYNSLSIGSKAGLLGQPEMFANIGRRLGEFFDVTPINYGDSFLTCNK
jgi:hypothetical protein